MARAGTKNLYSKTGEIGLSGRRFGRIGWLLFVLISTCFIQSVVAQECIDWQANHPDWIWCDDFESDTTLSSMYFEYGSDQGDFIRMNSVGFDSSTGMRALWQSGEVGAGNLHFSFGRSPIAGSSRIRSTEDFDEIYWRMYVRTQPGWKELNGSSPSAKLSRAFIFGNSSWGQAMIAHVWTSDNNPYPLAIDPASGIDANDNLATTRYNDFANFSWLGLRHGTTPLFSSANADQWFCVEAHVKLNTPGQSDGIFELWVNDNLEASRNDLDWVGNWSGYGINAVYFENHWNAGSPITQERYFDNIVISTQRIGCNPNASPGCCVGSTGNVDCDPGSVVDIADLTTLINHLFIDLQPLCCAEEGNIDGDIAGEVVLADLTKLIDHLFISLSPTALCR